MFINLISLQKSQNSEDTETDENFEGIAYKKINLIPR